MSSASHLQKDRQTERANRTLEGMLRHPIEPAENDWDVKLPCCKSAVNDARNIAAGNTLFLLNIRDHVRTPVNATIVTSLPTAKSCWDEECCCEQ